MSDESTGTHSTGTRRPGSPLTIGVSAQSTHRSMPLVELARATAERRFEALFVCEHTHMPTDHSGWPPGDQEDRWFAHLWDPFIALSFVAASTDLAIGTAVALPAQRDPIVLAKEIASLDQLSGGRLTLGFGWGWNRQEVANHGYPAADRVAVMAEKLALMKSLWSGRELPFDGTYVQMTESSSWPGPAQSPHPPILLGIPATPRNFDRIAAWADGWIPQASPLLDEDFPGQVAQARAAWAAAGHDPDRFDITIVQVPESPDRLRRALENARELGITRLLFVVTEADTSATLHQLDKLAALRAA